MPCVIYHTSIVITNPTSPSDRVTVETLAITCPSLMTVDAALTSLGLDGGDWDEVLEALASEGDASMVVLTRTVG